MAANADKDKAAKAKAKEKAAKAREKEKAAKAKQKERAAKAKEKEREAKRKEKEREAKRKEKEKAAKAKEKEREAKRKEKEKAAKAKEKAASTPEPKPEPEPEAAPVQPVEEVAVPERGETTEVRDQDEPDVQGDAALPELPELVVPDNDKTVRPKGYLAEALGKEDAVDRSTQRATLAASYTTRDHDIIRAWAHTRNGRPADVAGTAGRGRGRGTAGVLRIEFPDGPGDDGRLEDLDWTPFFETFDSSDVDFLYQERVRTGDVSRFHKFVRASA